MKRFFFGMILLLLAGCGEREPLVIAEPEEAKAVIAPFLKEMRAGNKEKAKAYISTAAYDELEAQFAADHKKLSNAPALTPRFTTQTALSRQVMGQEFPADGHEITVVYAAKQKDKWTSATVRMYRYRNEPYKVEYWRVTDKAPVQVLNSGVSEKMMKTQQQMMFITVAALSVFGIAGLALLFWIIRRKPHLVVNEAESEARRAASTVRDE